MATDPLDGNLSPFREGWYIRRPVTNLLTILRRLALQPETGQCLAAGLMFGLSFPCHPDHPLSFLFHPAWAWIALVPLLVALAAAPTAAPAPKHNARIVNSKAGQVGNATIYCM